VSAREVYIEQLDARFDLPAKYHPHWEPHSLCKLGDVGRVENGDWQRTGNAATRGLGELGTPIRGSTAPLSFGAGQNLKVQAELSGTTAPGFEFIGRAAAGIKISFGKADSLVIVATDTAYQQLPDDRAVARTMLDAFKDGERLTLGDQVVVGVLRAGKGMVLASAAGDAEVNVTSDAVVRQGTIDIAELKGNLAIANHTNMSYARSFPRGLILGHRALELHEKGIIARRPEVRAAVAAGPEYDLILAMD
jgi:hypothetical protein